MPSTFLRERIFDMISVTVQWKNTSKYLNREFSREAVSNLSSKPRDLVNSGPRDLVNSGPQDLDFGQRPRDLGTSGTRDLGKRYIPMYFVFSVE